MLELRDWLTLFVGLLGAFSSAAIAYLVYTLNRQTNKAQVDKAIADSYNQVMDFRADHPNVLKHSRLWNVNRFTQIYTQAKEEDEDWVHYYIYAELCLGFANNVLYAWKSHLLDRHSFEGHYKPLLRLILTEHEPFLSSVLPASPYISSYIKDFRDEQEKEGWNWKERHLNLAQSVTISK